MGKNKGRSFKWKINTIYLVVAWLTTRNITERPTTILRKNSLASHAHGSSSVAAAPLAVWRRPRRGASTLVSAITLSAGGPLRGGPRITTQPPSSTDLTIPWEEKKLVTSKLWK